MSYINDPNYQTILRRRRSRRRRHNMIEKALKALLFLAVVLIIGVGGFFIVKAVKNHQNASNPGIFDETSPASPDSETPELSIPSGTENAPAEDSLTALLSQADRLAAGYDYDRAIALLTSSPEYSGTQEVADAVAGYEAVKSTLVEADVSQVTHVFFHSLIMDTSKAFDGDAQAKGYNSVMTTKDEFLKILNEMYNRGFVLVRLHDLAHLNLFFLCQQAGLDDYF